MLLCHPIISKYHNEMRGWEGEERHKKNKKKFIKSWGRQEAAHELKCKEINKLSLASLLATNKGRASSRCLYGLYKIHWKESKLAHLAAAAEVKPRYVFNFTENMLLEGQSLNCKL